MMSQLSSQTIEVADVIAANELFHKRGWSDGLPIIPPTEKAVEQFLSISGLAADEVLGVEPVKGGVVTAEKAAINAVTAGCQPEYMRVVAAAVRAAARFFRRVGFVGGVGFAGRGGGRFL